MSDQKRSLSAFVLMPFALEFQDIYEFGIKAACLEEGVNCSRVDEQIFLGDIIDRIYEQIESADLIIGEMSGRTANVFYEVGYSKGVRKPVILVTKDANDIPFNLKHYPHVAYEGQITKLKAALKKRLQWFINNPETLDRTPPKNRFERMREQILNYFAANNYTRVSFERLGSLMKFAEEDVRELIAREPSLFRHALIKGNKPGIGLVKKKENADA